jgi:hypothetical protein
VTFPFSGMTLMINGGIQEEFSMKTAFRVRTSFKAEVELSDDTLKAEIVTNAVRQAETLSLGRSDYAVFDVGGRPLKVVIQFAKREIHIVTTEEAKGFR